MIRRQVENILPWHPEAGSDDVVSESCCTKLTLSRVTRSVCEKNALNKAKTQFIAKNNMYSNLSILRKK
jgi:hypothetical protein